MNDGFSIGSWQHGIGKLFLLDGLLILSAVGSRPLQVQVQVLVCLLFFVSGGILLFQLQVDGADVNVSCTFIPTCHLRCRNDIIFVVQVAIVDMRLILDLNFLALHSMVIFFFFITVGVHAYVHLFLFFVLVLLVAVVFVFFSDIADVNAA